ncbi:MAG: ABC transporter ATP-binding protein [Clostridiales bacterium]
MKKIIQDYFILMEKYKKHFNRALTFAIIRGLFDAVQIAALYLGLRDVFTSGISAITIWRSLGLLLISVTGAALTSAYANIQKTNFGYHGGAEARMRIAGHLQSIGMGYFNENSLGHVSATATTSVQLIQEAGTTIVYSFLEGLISSLIISLMILLFNWKIGLTALLGVLLFFSTISWMQRRALRHTDDYSRIESELVSTVLEFIQGLPVVKSFNRDRVESDALQKNIQTHSDLIYQMERDWIPVAALQKTILGCTGVAIVAVALVLALMGQLQVYEMLTAMVTSWMIFLPLEMAGQFAFLLRQLGNNQHKVQEILAIPALDEKSTGKTTNENGIVFSHVSFSYEARPILKDVSFAVPEKTTTAIVGPSGSGKTTINNLLARFWDVDQGSITIGGVDIRDYSLDELMKKISIVFQDVYLFNDTIANNIRFGRPEATMAEVKAAAEKACCHEFIEAMAQGYETIVGERGATLSGGEKQRISIARCLIKDAPIILLDEATANVDPENEEKLKRAIDALLHEKTVVMIAHRLKTVEQADQIITLADGQVKQRGTHQILAGETGIYRDFLNARYEALNWSL